MLSLTTPTNRDRIAEEAGKNLVESMWRLVFLAKDDPHGAHAQRQRIDMVQRQLKLLDDALHWVGPRERDRALAELADVARRAA